MKILKSNKGFTLIELVLAVAILLVVITPMYNMFVVSMKTTAMSQQELDDLTETQKLFEEIKTGTDSYTIDGNQHHHGNGLYYQISPVSGYTHPGTGTDYMYEITVQKKDGSDVLQEIRGTAVREITGGE